MQRFMRHFLDTSKFNNFDHCMFRLKVDPCYSCDKNRGVFGSHADLCYSCDKKNRGVFGSDEHGVIS